MTMTIKIANDILFQPLGDEAMLLDMKTERYFGLNAVGQRFWTLLAEGTGQKEIQDRLLAEFDVAPDLLLRDVGNLISQLEKRNLITVERA